MISWARYVFVIIAYSMALLHTAVPHRHAGTPRGGETILVQAGCVPLTSDGGLLQRALSTDLGYGHLETFNKEADCVIALPALCDLSGLLHVFSQSFFKTSLLPSIDGEGYVSKLTLRLLLFSSAHFRAPPATF